MYTYTHTRVHITSLLTTAKKHLTRPESTDRARNVAHPVLPPQGPRLPFAAVPQHRVISKSEMFRLLSSVAEETPLHVQDIVRIPAVPEEEEMGFSISKDHNLSNGVFIPRINFKV